jgi:hypothetical protein
LFHSFLIINRISVPASFSLALAGLTGCAGPGAVALESLVEVVKPSTAVAAAPLNPQYQYLRITSNGKPALMVRGTASPAGQQTGSVTWYSADKEVLELNQGRITLALGTPVEWRSVQATWPTWPQGTEPLVYQRQRDVTAPVRYGLNERIRLQKLNAGQPRFWLQPPGKAPLPTELSWYSETMEPQTRGEGALPVALFGVQGSGAQARVVYSEQCLSATVCLSLQEWPAQ